MRSLLYDFKNYEQIMEYYFENNELTFSKYNFIANTTLLPLLTMFNVDTIINSPSKPKVKKYMEDTLKNNSKSTCIPFKEITHENIKRDIIQKEVMNILRTEPDKNSYFYVLGEMFSNIDDHSQFTKAYFSAQEYPNMQLIDLGIIDNGISIPCSYDSSPSLPDNEYIEKALDGESTKNEEERGFGLRTTTNYITSVPKGEILIVSHSGVYYKKRNRIISKLTEYGFVDGTFISIRFDSKMNNLYKYLE